MLKLSAVAAKKLGIRSVGPGKQSPGFKTLEAVGVKTPARPQVRLAPVNRLPEPAGPVTVRVLGRPVPKEAARFSEGRFHRGKKTANYEKAVRQVAWLEMAGRAPFSGPVSVEMVYVKPVPVSFGKRKTEQALAGEILPDTKPDFDNLNKSFMDGLKTIVFEDDAQVCVFSFRKIFGRTEMIVVTVSAVGKPGNRESDARKSRKKSKH